MHFEIERSARDEYHARRGAGFEGILDLLGAIAAGTLPAGR